VDLRRAVLDDVEHIAQLFRRTRAQCMPYLPVLHTPEEDIAYFRDVVFRRCSIWLAERDTIIGFCAFRPQWLDHLYVDPMAQGGGIGSHLLTVSLRENSVLNLWVFQKNTAAIRFYEKRGFKLVEKTDGAANEEREPDAWYRKDL